MTGFRGRKVRMTTEEARLDDGRPRVPAAWRGQLAGFDHPLRTVACDLRCPNRPQGQSWPYKRRVSGECRFDLDFDPVGGGAVAEAVGLGFEGVILDHGEP